MNKKIIIGLIVSVTVLILSAGAYASSSNIDVAGLKDMKNITVDSKSLDESNGLYHSSDADSNPILIKNGGNLKLTNSFINKTGDTASTGDDADFYGINSGILVNTNGTLDISNVEINTNSKGSNGIFVTNAESSSNSGDSTQTSGEAQSPEDGQNQGGEGTQPPEAPGDNPNQGENGNQPPEAPGDNPNQEGDGGQGQGNSGQGGETTVSGTTQANIKDVTITTHSDKSRGLDATYNGIINGENVIINTDGQSCAALATDRGEGQVHVKNSKINTGVSKESGRGSPLIYSTGNITAENTEGTAYVSQIACIEGKNSIELSNCDLKGAGGGNRQDGSDYVDLGGIFIYQSMSGDADVGTSIFKATDSKLSIPSNSPVYSKGPMFHITNTACDINLEKTELSFGSGIFLEVAGQNQWGNEGSNGGTVKLNTDNENIDGNVTVDEISNLNWTMKNTQYKGTINSSGNTTVNVADGSTWTLTGNSTLSSLEQTGNIDYGQYSLTVGGKTYNDSNPYKA